MSRRSWFVAALALTLWPVAPADAASAPLEASIVSWCMPQLEGCRPPDDPCAGIAPIDRPMGVLLTVTQGDRPVTFATVRVRSDDVERTAWTNSRGMVKLALRPASVTSIEVTDGRERQAVPLSPFWGQVHVEPPGALMTASAGDSRSFPLAVRLVGMGRPPSPFGGLTIADDAGALQGVVIKGGRASLEVSRQSPGTVRYDVVDVDACGLRLDGPASFAVRWDALPERLPAPPPSIHLPSMTGWWTTKPLQVTPSATGEVEWSLDGVRFQRGPILLAEGVHKLHAYALGPNGDRSGTITREYRVDATPPTIVVPPAAWMACVDIPLTITDAVSGVNRSSVTFDDSSIAHSGLGVDGRTLVAAPDGRHVVTARARDLAGNVAVATAEFLCDSAPPTLEVRMLDPEEGGPRALDVQASDAGSGVASLDARMANGTWVPLDELVIDEGEIEVRAIDRAGHVALRSVDSRRYIEPPITSNETATPAVVEERFPDLPPRPRVEFAAVSSLGDLIRVAGAAPSARSGTAFLVDAGGQAVALAEIRFAGAAFSAEGLAPGPGIYDVRLEFLGENGEALQHAAGRIVIEPPPGPGDTGEVIAPHSLATPPEGPPESATPGPAALFTLAAMALAALVSARRRRT